MKPKDVVKKEELQCSRYFWNDKEITKEEYDANSERHRQYVLELEKQEEEIENSSRASRKKIKKH
jgi:glutamate synthase domain-containing protein 1